MVFFYIHSQRDQHAVVEIKKLPNFTVITDPKFFESAEISGVSQVTANSSLRMTSFEFSNLLVVLTNIFMKKVYLQTGFVSAWSIILVCLPGLLHAGFNLSSVQ